MPRSSARWSTSAVAEVTGAPLYAQQADTLRPAARLAGEVQVPADKSIAHRALIMAALAAGESRIEAREVGLDVTSTATALRSLGVRLVLDQQATTFTVQGLGTDFELGRLGGGRADCANSGTTMRLLCGALASGAGRAVLTGDRSLSGRPMERVASPLRAMGAEIQTTDGHAPLTVEGRRPLRALEHDLPVASAQVLGAIALAALAAEGRTTIRVPGRTRDHTERLLTGLGASVSRTPTDDGGTLTTVDGPAVLRAQSIRVPGDFSSAAAWLVAGSIHHDAEIRQRSVGLNPTRTALLEVLREMGAAIDVQPTGAESGEPVGDLIVRSAGGLRGVSVGPELVPALIDELPLLAVAMAAADGVSEVRGASELRVKESDRIATMAAALGAAGARVEELPDGWRISRGTPREAAVVTGGDHRVAMAMSVAAWTGVAASVTLDDEMSVGVSYPLFWTDARTIGAGQ
jgi:3-phosphoshikimate 1-carboxyvinyltransferase